MTAGPDGLHIDDYRGTAGTVTWLSGCFCRHCMAALPRVSGRERRRRRSSPSWGSPTSTTFDYRQFLLDRGVKPEDYKQAPRLLAAGRRVPTTSRSRPTPPSSAEYHRRAKKLRGKPLTLVRQLRAEQPPGPGDRPAPELLLLRGGPQRRRPGARPTHPIYVYKLADGLDRPVTSTASGQDWAYVMRAQPARAWSAPGSALSYAFGHTLMAPHRQWCYTKEKGTHWYAGPTEEYAWLYQFVRQHARLLDGYEAVAPVAVVYDNAARRKGRGNIEPICVALAERNIPFTVVVAGDDWLDYRLDAERLARFKAVVVAEGPGHGRRPAEADRRRSRPTAGWSPGPTTSCLEKLVPAPVVDRGQRPGLGRAPGDPGRRRGPGGRPPARTASTTARRTPMVPQKDFTLRLRHDLFGGGQLFPGRPCTPRRPSRSRLDVTPTDEYTYRQVVPQLELWGIVELGKLTSRWRRHLT